MHDHSFSYIGLESVVHATKLYHGPHTTPPTRIAEPILLAGGNMLSAKNLKPENLTFVAAAQSDVDKYIRKLEHTFEIQGTKVIVKGRGEGARRPIIRVETKSWMLGMVSSGDMALYRAFQTVLQCMSDIESGDAEFTKQAFTELRAKYIKCLSDDVLIDVQTAV